MADLSKFEQMLERLINEDSAGAQELFHDIVVEKSRSIYESLLESDDEDEDEDCDESTDEDEEDCDESADEDNEDDLEENFNLDEFEVEGDDDMMGGDPTDNLIGDLGASGDEEGDEFDMSADDAGEGDVEDRVVDLEDALDELKAEFEKMMSGEEDEEGYDDEEGYGDEEGEEDEEGYDDEEESDFGDDGEEEEEESFQFEAKKDKKDDKKAEKKSSSEQMREYVEKVSSGHGAEKKGSGDNGVNNKSAVAKPNHMGSGTSQNIAKNHEAKGGNTQGLGDLNAKDQNGGNINVPGGKASKAQKPVAKGHGTEKKGSRETAANTKPIIGSGKK
jgi:hypothetical protein